MNLKANSEKFINRIKKQNHISLIPFCLEEWFRGSYSTIQRTLRAPYSPIAAQRKPACRQLVFDGLIALKEEDFDSGFKALTLALKHEFRISIGHSQKLLSIVCKYAYTVYHHDPTSLPDDWRKFIAANESRLPVPIDAIVLCALSTKHSCQFMDVKAAPPSASIQVGLKEVAWSRLEDYATYWSLQVRLRALAKTQRMTPLEFEMEKLWAA